MKGEEILFFQIKVCITALPPHRLLQNVCLFLSAVSELEKVFEPYMLQKSI